MLTSGFKQTWSSPSLLPSSHSAPSRSLHSEHILPTSAYVSTLLLRFFTFVCRRRDSGFFLEYARRSPGVCAGSAPIQITPACPRTSSGRCCTSLLGVLAEVASFHPPRHAIPPYESRMTARSEHPPAMRRLGTLLALALATGGLRRVLAQSSQTSMASSASTSSPSAVNTPSGAAPSGPTVGIKTTVSVNLPPTLPRSR